MAQKFDSPKTETDLRIILDEIYAQSKIEPSFKGLIEITSAETTIVTAIHNIKSNKGSKTPGVDGKRMQKDYLEKPQKWVINDIQSAFRYFKAEKIRREYIDKPGKLEKRPLGIPTIRDRIVQECIRIVLEPIMEAQFYKYSFGFRPMRDTQMALRYVTNCVFTTGYHWIVEGDISKCFDKINHGILLKRLYHMGVKDRRVIQIIKAMLKAGIIGECEINEDGTPQGGILSPLLSNVYLDILDEWISKQWESKPTKIPYKKQNSKIFALKKSDLIPGYICRYADDFVIITDSKEHALWWKQRIQDFLWNRMRLNLSEEKTLVTDVRKQYIKFLGYEFKMVKGKGKYGYITRTIPDRKRLKLKVCELKKEIKEIPKDRSREQAIHKINLINSKIRGVINYYTCCTWVNISMKKYAHDLRCTGKRSLKRYKGKWIPANQTHNLANVHGKYTMKIPSIKYRDIWVGITDLTFCNWEEPYMKAQAETPYSEEGRQLCFKRTKKKRQNARLDGMLNTKVSELISTEQTDKDYNFEFYMNRAYALNRDRLKCRVCGAWLIDRSIYTHRIKPDLPINKVNKVANLASMDRNCYELVNKPQLPTDNLDKKTRGKIEIFRDKLVSKCKKYIDGAPYEVKVSRTV